MPEGAPVEILSDDLNQYLQEPDNVLPDIDTDSNQEQNADNDNESEDYSERISSIQAQLEHACGTQLTLKNVSYAEDKGGEEKLGKNCHAIYAEFKSAAIYLGEGRYILLEFEERVEMSGVEDWENNEDPLDQSPEVKAIKNEPADKNETFTEEVTKESSGDFLDFFSDFFGEDIAQPEQKNVSPTLVEPLNQQENGGVMEITAPVETNTSMPQTISETTEDTPIDNIEEFESFTDNEPDNTAELNDTPSSGEPENFTSEPTLEAGSIERRHAAKKEIGTDAENSAITEYSFAEATTPKIEFSHQENDQEQNKSETRVTFTESTFEQSSEIPKHINIENHQTEVVSKEPLETKTNQVIAEAFNTPKNAIEPQAGKPTTFLETPANTSSPEQTLGAAPESVRVVPDPFEQFSPEPIPPSTPESETHNEPVSVEFISNPITAESSVNLAQEERIATPSIEATESSQSTPSDIESIIVPPQTERTLALNLETPVASEKIIDISTDHIEKPEVLMDRIERMELKVETPHIPVENLIPREASESTEHSWIQLMPEIMRVDVMHELEMNEISTEIVLVGERTPDGKLCDATIVKIDNGKASFEFRETPENIPKGDYALRRTYESYQWQKKTSPEQSRTLDREHAPIVLQIDSHFDRDHKTKARPAYEKIEPGLRIDFPTQNDFSSETQRRYPQGVSAQDETTNKNTSSRISKNKPTSHNQKERVA